MSQSNKCDEQDRERLWELIYDLLEPEEAEALRARITSEPALARAYSEARLRTDLVAAAARQEEARLPLSLPSESGDSSDSLELSIDKDKIRREDSVETPSLIAAKEQVKKTTLATAVHLLLGI